MSRLTFKMNTTLKSIINHARNSKEFAPCYGAKPEPGLFFVHDSGIYLMSAGTLGLLVEEGKPNHVVAYANGCNPDAPDSWEHCRELVGGDDFGELLPLSWFANALERGASSITLHFSKKQISFTTTMPKRVVSKVSGESVSGAHAAKQFAEFDAWKAAQS